MEYGKLEIVVQDAEDKEARKFTVEDFTDLKEFVVDNMHETLRRNLQQMNEKNNCKDCAYSYEAVLAASPTKYVLKVSMWAKKNILECAGDSLMECFYNFIDFYYELSSFRRDLKKKSLE